MRAFVAVRSIVASNTDVLRRLAALQRRTDRRLAVVFGAIREILEADRPRRSIGFGAG